MENLFTTVANAAISGMALLLVISVLITAYRALREGVL